METFRCPTCIGVLPDAQIRRCTVCGQRMRRRRPRVLGEEHRIGASNLPIDRWMLERLHMQSRKGRKALPPVAWHGRFATSPLAEPAFASTPSPVATPLAPPLATTLAPPLTPPVIDTPVPDPEPQPMAPTIGALTLDMYTSPVAQPEVEPEPEFVPAPVPVVLEAPPVLTPTKPAPISAKDLDPEVRAIVDELYEQARAELSGSDLGFFAPLDEGPVDFVDDDIEDEDMNNGSPIAHLDVRPHDVIAVEAPEEPRRSRRGWVAAFVTDDERKQQS